MDIAAPRNKTASKSVAFSEKSPGTLLIQSAKKPPRIKGATIPATETEAALRALDRNRSILNSVPTRNM
jgi:hypothetical protein